MKSADIRKKYIEFFNQKGHRVLDSAPMVVQGDPSLMFVNAGMNQFKDVFLSNTKPKDLRVVNSQKCLRVSGKHNDLEQVGVDTYHHTMFEMLGNWSFGDYFKEEAISWAWEFLTDVCSLDKDRIYVTVFQGDKEDGLDKDHESFNIWKKYVDASRILDGSKKDNFWEMGEMGPCGPCSEIHFDNRNDADRKEIDGKDLVNKDHPDVIEIWNLVFIEYNRKADQSLDLLPEKHVDTGMGLERLSMVMQQVRSNYDTDVFMSLISSLEKISSVKYGDDDQSDIAMRVVSDHIRAISFSIADGQLPSNVKAGYVIRRILRRAVRYGYTFLGLKSPFMFQLVDVLCDQMGDFFNELASQKELIKKVIEEEEKSFLRTLVNGLDRLSDIISKSENQVSGKEAFELYDTYGFPVDLTALILSENNLNLDMDMFHEELAKQKERSRKASKVDTDDWNILLEDDIQEFVGYDTLETKVKIVKYRKIRLKDSEAYQMVFNLTPFYPEGGGQVGDTGSIEGNNEIIEIFDTKKDNNLIVHLSTSLPEDLHGEFLAKVDKKNRVNSSRNHTATHLLHEALRDVLGDHVMQKGSLVCPDYLRFDFSHFQKLSDSELSDIIRRVNDKISENIPLNEHDNMPLEKAKEMGAMMLFGEKYGDAVRVIEFDRSIELCGGTHVSFTSDLSYFKILSESSISAGIRRIEAITGDRLKEEQDRDQEMLREIGSMIKNKDIVQGVKELILENKSLLKENKRYKALEIKGIGEGLLLKKEDINGVQVILDKLYLDIASIKSLSMDLRRLESSLALLLASECDNKVFLSLMITDDLIEKGIDASDIIKSLAPYIHGGGGGSSSFASAGGSNATGIDEAFSKFKEIIGK